MSKQLNEVRDKIEIYKDKLRKTRENNQIIVNTNTLLLEKIISTPK